MGSRRERKSSKLVPFAIIGVASVVVVGGMFYVAGQQQQTNRPAPARENSNLATSSDNGSFGDVGDGDQRQLVSFEEESEQRLAELREREAELDTIYEGTEATVYQGQQSDPVLLEGESGQFSDFDVAREPAAEVDPAPATEPEPETDLELKGSATEEPAPDDLLTRSLMDEAPGPTVPGIAELRIASLEDRIDALGAELQEMASTQSTGDMPTDAILAPLREDIATLDRRVADLADRLEDLGDVSDSVDGERLASLAQRFEAFSGDMTQRLEGLDERLAEVADSAAKSASSSLPAPSSAPRRPAVSGLYKLLAIEGNVAVLEGQNTGRTYRIAEGGDLAYGGRLLDLSGDQAVLAWPHRSIELSIYGE